MLSSSEAFYKHVVYVYFNISPDLIFKYLVDESLISSSGILQSKGHHLITVEALVCDESGLLLVGSIHLNLVVPREGIHEVKGLVPHRLVYQCVDPREGEAIFWARLVKVGEVDAHSPLFAQLSYHYHVG